VRTIALQERLCDIVSEAQAISVISVGDH
jgi:hypothetical protein